MSNLISFFDDYSVFFLFSLIALTDAGLPIPLPYDLMILLGGQRGLPLWKVLVAVVPGAVLGNSILYFLANTFGYSFLEKYEKFFSLTHRTHKKMEGWFLKYGVFFLIVARLVPGLRFTASFSAGLFRLPYKSAFVPAMTFASTVWAIGYYYAGRIIGEGIFSLLQFGSHFRIFSLLPIIIILTVVAWIAFKVKISKASSIK